MDIRLFVHGLASLSPDLLAEVQEGMGECGGNRGERETIGDGEGGRNKERAIRFVCLLVERRIGV